MLLGAAGTAQAQPQPSPSPDQSTTTISINPGNVPTTAAEFTQNCDPNLGGGPYPDRDVWVFNLPDQTRDFVSVTATFSIPGDGTATVTIPEAEDSAIVRIGTSKAWVIVPEGWTLVTATAVVTGEPEPGLQFVLTQTCAASPSPTASPTVSPTASPTGSPTASPTKSQLPITGTSGPGSLLPLTVLGATAIALGGFFLIAHRRRGATG
ncbi:hypothetical protein NCC78_09955 [Micromonospora phytophila]|uniref:hypothetical protein n=1 Tax=Micromonospora phytophila TaxID=709888 RepID=UPI00202EBED4|nr:hypothetical protein [Micromonospora phytophila]MCM0675010.1 hypothetical protein [Micromonospora phytophila]